MTSFKHVGGSEDPPHPRGPAPAPEDPPHPCHTSAYISFPVLLYIIMWSRIWRVYAIITAFPFSRVCLHLYWPVSLLAWVHPSEISFLLLSVLGRYSLYVHLSEETITLLLSSNCLGMNSQLEISFLCRLKALLRPHPRARAAAGMSSHHPIFLILSSAGLDFRPRKFLVLFCLSECTWVLHGYFRLVSSVLDCDKICFSTFGKLDPFYHFFLLFLNYVWKYLDRLI